MVPHKAQWLQSLNRGPAGVVHTGKIEWFEPMDRKVGKATEFSVDALDKLPRVDVIYALAKLAKAGTVVVRSTRLPEGIVLRNNEVDDDKMGFVASGELNPAKSRVLLQLALTKTKDPKKIQEMFYTY